MKRFRCKPVRQATLESELTNAIGSGWLVLVSQMQVKS